MTSPVDIVDGWERIKSDLFSFLEAFFRGMSDESSTLREAEAIAVRSR